MKSFYQLIPVLAALSIVALWSPPGHTAGLMTPSGSDLPQLIIKEHHVNVVIEDGYAITSVEQDSYRTFAVYPVRAGQDVRTRLTYIQSAHVDTSIGRYVYPLEDGGVDEEKLSFWTNNESVEERFSFNLTFRSPWPIDDFRLPAHPQANIQKLSEWEWNVSLVNENADDEEGAASTASPSVVHSRTPVHQRA